MYLRLPRASTPLTRIALRPLLLVFLLCVTAPLTSCSTHKAYLTANAKPIAELCPVDDERLHGPLTRGDCNHRLRTYAAEASCHAGNDLGCAYAAYYYRNEDSPIFELDKGVELAAIGCERGSPVACLAQATTLYKGDNDIYENGQAYNLLRRTCLEGMGLSCHYMAGWYRNDPKNARERRLAAGYYKKSCEYGHPAGCRKFAEVYEIGFGVARNKERATALYTRACKMDDAKACRKAGIVPSNEAEEAYNEYLGISNEDMVEMYWASCESGFRHGCTYLGRLIKDGHLKGRYVFESDRITDTFSTGCKQGSAESCYYLAERHLNGWGSLEGNTVTAAKYAQMACEHGYPKGCDRYRNYRYRTFPLRAAEAFAKKCAAGDGEACFLAGMAFNYDRTFDRSTSRSVKLLEKGCDIGYADACEEAGKLFDNGKFVDQDYARANQHFERACELGADAACYALAVNYQNGNGVAQSSTLSMKFDKIACSRGHGGACGSVGYHYSSGDGTKKNDELGRKFSERGCNHGHLWSCNNFAGDLRARAGGDEDDERARSIFEWTCQRGSARGCLLYGTMLASGEGAEDGKADILEAAKRYEMGCLGEDGASCRYLAELYANGKHFPKSQDKALALYEQGCRYGDSRSCMRFANVELDRTPKRAMRFLARACDLGQATACMIAAKVRGGGPSALRDVDLSGKLFEKSCENGKVEECLSASYYLRFGYDGVTKDEELADKLVDRAISRLRKACFEEKKAGACPRAAHVIAHARGTETDFEAAQEHLEDACTSDIGFACNTILAERKRGELFPRDLERVTDALEESCDEDDPKACADFARLLYERGTEKALEQAFSAYQKTCQLGTDASSQVSCLDAAAMLARGLGVERDAKRAVELFEKGCNKEATFFCDWTALTGIYWLHPDEFAETSFYALEAKKCEKHPKLACLRKGRMLQSGLQVERSPKKAKQAYEKACQAKNPTACSRKRAIEIFEAFRAKHGIERAAAACDNGVAKGCLVAGVDREFGSHEPGRLAEAGDYYAKSCKLGLTDGCRLHVAVEVDSKGPVAGKRRWASLARICEFGSAEQCYSVGSAIARDHWHLGVAQWRRGCEKGHEKSCRKLDRNGFSRPSAGKTPKKSADTSGSE